MTSGFAISAVTLVLLLSFKTGYPMPLASKVCSMTVEDYLKPWLLTTPPCNLSGKNRSTAVCLRNEKDEHKLRANVTMNYNETVNAGHTASFLSRVSDSVGSTGPARTHPCTWKNEYTEDHAQMPSWRVGTHPDDQSGTLVLASNKGRTECQCEAIVAPFNVLTFTCSGDSEKWTWTTTSVIVGYTCTKKV